jgi:cytochrome c556
MGLFDFGKVAQMGLAVGNLEETQRRNDISETNSVTEQGRLKVMQDRLAADQQQNATAHFTQLMKLSDDPRVRANPDLEDAVFSKIGEVSGFPQFQDKETMSRGRESLRKTFKAMQSNDPQTAKDGLVELAISASPEDFKKFVDSTSKFQDMQQTMENVGLMREIKQAQFEKLHDSQSRVNAGQIPYTDAAQSFSQALKGTDSKEFAQAMKFADSFKAKGGPVNKNIAALYSDGGLQKFTGVEVSQIAEMATGKASRYLDVANQSQQALDLLEHGGEVPPGVTKADLRHRATVGRQVSEAYTTLATWSNDPFDATKLKEAKAAFKIVENERKNMDKLNSSNQAEAISIRQNAQTFKESEAYQKHLQAQNKTQAQNEFSAWYGSFQGKPTDQQMASEAARIGAAYSTPTEDVTVAIKNHNKPLVENKITTQMTQEREESKKVGGGFGDQFVDIMKADVKAQGKLARLSRMEELLKGLETGGLVPTLTKIQNVAQSLGFQVDPSLGPKQALEALSNEVALSFRDPSGGAGLPGAMSDPDREFVVNMAPGLSKTKEGNALIIETAKKLAKRDMEVAKLAREYRKKHGQMDEGFYDELAAFSEKNPMFEKSKAPASPRPSQSKPTTPTAPIDPYTDKGKESRYQKWLQEHPEYQ